MSESTSRPGEGGQGYRPEQDPDADPEMIESGGTADEGENTRDPAEGAADESADPG